MSDRVRVHVPLLTLTGKFVITAVIPPFISPGPDVLVWGDRMFKREPVPDGADGEFQYRECFAVYVVETVAE